MIRSPSSLAAALLTSRLLPLEVKPFTAREFWTTFNEVSVLETLIEMDIDQILRSVGCSMEIATRTRSLLDASRAFAFESERLEGEGITPLTAFDENFPSRLRDKLRNQCPVMLLVTGQVEWLAQPSIGIVGSRNVSKALMDTAAEIARAAVRGGHGVVSGLARGIDQISMGSALEVGGQVIGIPSEGIRVVSRNVEVRSAVHDGDLVIASPYGPDAPFTPGNAMGRNKVIYGLATATVVVTSDEGKGGTWSGATEALNKNYGRVVVWESQDVGPGNAGLIKKGGQSMSSLQDDSWMFESEPALDTIPTAVQLKLL